MKKTKLLLLIIFFNCLPSSLFAEEKHQSLFHLVNVEMSSGQAESNDYVNLDLDGWLGGDEHKFWFKSEIKNENDKIKKNESWALYSKKISDFWDFQIGLRSDQKPTNDNFLAIGLNGLAPYFFETEAFIFLSDTSGISARIRQNNELLLTQKFILEPFIEVNIHAKDINETNVKKGISDYEFGLQARYEISRKFAPYVEFRYENKFGETAKFAKENNLDGEEFVTFVGVKILF